MLKYLYSVLITLLSVNAFAANIKGKVTDSKNNEPLTGVTVVLTGAGKGAVTDVDGNYEIADVQAGTYEIVFTYATYITYKQSITIKSENVVLDMKLMPETTQLKDHVVKSAKITHTEASVVNEIKMSNAVVSGVGASQIAKTMDRNAADVVKRVPGVTIQDDRFIIIRGLPDRYNTVWLNDASTPSSESDKKSFSFDIIPSGLIDRLLIYKTPSPELPGDFAGGMVKVYTTSIADKNTLSVGLSTSSRQYTTGTDFNYQNTSKTDWLGYDDGSRSLPSVIPAEKLDSKMPDYKTNIGEWSKSFGNDWMVNTKQASPDLRFSLAASNVLKLKKFTLGNTFGGSYSNTYTNYNVERQQYTTDSEKVFHYNDQRSSNTANASVMDNIGVSIGNSKIEFKNLYNQTGTSLLTYRTSVRDSMLEINDEKSYLMQYESRATYSTQLTGAHKNNDDTRKYTWSAGYNDLFRNMPNRRILKYLKNQGDSVYATNIPAQPDILNGGRMYLTLFEKTYSFNHQFTQKFTLKKKYEFEVNVGNFIEYKSRAFNIRQFGYTIRRSSTSKALQELPVNEIFADSNVDGLNKFKIGETTNPYDKYSGDNKLIASFVSLKAQVNGFNAVGGVRYEDNVQSLLSYINTNQVNPQIHTKFLLPSVNASYNFSKESLIRAAYGKTLNRPEFRETAPIFFYDFDELAGYYGSMFPTVPNPTGDTLKVAEIQNFDLRYELYPGAGEMVQVGGFYKSFKNPIQRVVNNGGDNQSYTFSNAKNGYCYGLEIDVRKNLGWLDKQFKTNFFSDFTLVGNVSLVKSVVYADTTTDTSTIYKSTMVGQSPYIINAGLFYQGSKNGLQGSLLFNVAGPRMYALGSKMVASQSIGEMPFKSLDFSLSKVFFKHYVLNVGVQNLLNSKVYFVKDLDSDNKFGTASDREIKSFNPGRYYTVGVKIKF